MSEKSRCYRCGCNGFKIPACPRCGETFYLGPARTLVTEVVAWADDNPTTFVVLCIVVFCFLPILYQAVQLALSK